ncbi:MAG: WYL domain-containing protein [Deltaproteobacteria bacterium]|nr:WYL domain-containing protein [Deltaproteobacteria bacterium]
MLQAIIDAIINRKVLSFTYSGITRVVEPHAVGVSRAGNDVLRCFQIQGSHLTPGHEWDLCKISDMSNLSTTGQCFKGERQGYKRGDKHMTAIYAEL